MQGTRHVHSLVRLLLGAVLLCVAWILLSATQAGAAERGDAPKAPPATFSPARLSPAKPFHAKPSHTKPSPAKPSLAAGLRPLKATATPSPVPVAPVVARVEQAVGATVPVVERPVARATQVVAAALPVVEKPVGQVTQVVVAIVDQLPVVGGGEALPLPGPEGTGSLPTSGPADSSSSDARNVGAQRSTLLAPSSEGASDSAPTAGAELRAGSVSSTFAGVPDRGPASTDPWPTQPKAPMPPTSPSAAAGPAPADLATTSPTVSLLPPGASGRDHADWHVPGSLPAAPGTRPD